MFEALVVQSHKGPYEARFDDDALALLNDDVPATAHFIVDSRVAELYRTEISNVLRSQSVLLVEALEVNKSLEKFPRYVEDLLTRSIRRTHVLIAIGGGIIQDITCFLAATLFRGVSWHFYPTTLLAQADSCIGSKSSINCGAAKNILGTFTPPDRVVISTKFLDTLDERDIRSGIGEMLKVQAIDGPESFRQIARDYDGILADRGIMLRWIERSLAVKKRIIEVDEFDRGPRNVMNYGHSFGHAIEAATDFGIPHGIAITIGMDLANFVSASLCGGSFELCADMHEVLRRNYRGFERTVIPMERFMGALTKDKKNTDDNLSLILPDGRGRIGKVAVANDERFRAACEEYLAERRSR